MWPFVSSEALYPPKSVINSICQSAKLVNKFVMIQLVWRKCHFGDGFVTVRLYITIVTSFAL